MVEAQAAPETKECPLCKKQIEIAKFRLHEVACARQNYICKKCGEVVAKADREEHDEECGKPKVEKKPEPVQPPAPVP